MVFATVYPNTAWMESLSPELVAEIFLTGVEDSEWHVWFLPTIRYLSAISTVSTQWRAIALSTPQLWSGILFKPPHSRRQKAASLLPYLLERSHSVSFELVLDLWDVTSTEIILLKNVFSSHLHRCQRIEILEAGRGARTELLPLSSFSSLMELRILSLKFNDQSPSQDDRILESPNDCSKLVKLTTSGVYARSLEYFPSKSLKMLHLHEFSDWAAVRLFLAQYPLLTVLGTQIDLFILAPQLEHLSCLYFNRQEELTSEHPIKHPTLFKAKKAALAQWRPTPSLFNVETLDLIECERASHVFDLLLMDVELSSGKRAPMFFPSLRILRLRRCAELIVGPHPHNYGHRIANVLGHRQTLHIESDGLFVPSRMKAPELYEMFHDRFQEARGEISYNEIRT